MNRVALGCLLAAALLAVPAQAEAAPANVAFRLGPVAVHGSDAHRVQLAAGAFDLDGEDTAPALNAELRLGPRLFVIGPSLGVVANTDGGLYGYFGAFVELSWGNVILTPMLAAGGYHEGSSKDLGGVFQFRQSLDLAYAFEDGMRVGVQVAHISNAGIYDQNPGVEAVYLTWSIPIGR